MLSFPRYEGVDLPVHSPDTYVVDGAPFGHEAPFNEAIALAAGSTIVRGVGILLRDEHNNGFELPLKELLKRTDEELAVLTDELDIDVIPYEWGLYPIKEHPPRKYGKYKGKNAHMYIPNLPVDHILVAEVGIVRNRRPLNFDESRVYHHSLDKYYARGGLQLRDHRQGARQATVGICDLGTEANRRYGTKLVDIEPRFSVTGRS